MARKSHNIAMRTIFLTILIKLKVTHKNTTLWSFNPYFLFLVWFKFHIVFIFLHSLCPHPETTEGFRGRKSIVSHFLVGANEFQCELCIGIISYYRASHLPE